MISLSSIEPAMLNPRPNLLAGHESVILRPNRPWDQPDIKINPKFWLKLYLEGLTLHSRSFALAARADNVLDLGCGSGWFSIALAKRRPDVRIEALDTDTRLLDWGRQYMDQMASEGKSLGRIRFAEQDVDEFPWHKYEEQFDLVHAGFILSRVKKPEEALSGIYKVLKPGGWVIYHDVTDAPPRNLNRFSRVQHFFEKWKNVSSDPWSWRRHWERRYRFDMARLKARAGEPDEKDVIRRFEELFAMRFHERRRAFLDIFLREKRTRMSTYGPLIPAVKLCDDVMCKTNLLVGAVRYVLGQKR